MGRQRCDRTELNYHRTAERLFIASPRYRLRSSSSNTSSVCALFTRSTREVALTDVGALGGLATLTGRTEPHPAWVLLGTGADLLYRLVRHKDAAPVRPLMPVPCAQLRR
ncbi:hypothetical protein [Mycolicibacterium baixiangningiae]|uniref:hypothetical protein n=1 Tax=Mycolicibacterium baixiangningiae TaxID=2761578 RepID=UPI001866719C|nr:hypothetical protein [Mycolicibacterium baixiangningiae]